MLSLPFSVIQLSFLQITWKWCSRDPYQPQCVFMLRTPRPHRSPSVSAPNTKFFRSPTSETGKFPLTSPSPRQCTTGCFTELSKAPFIPLYCAIVRPHREYAMKANATTLQGPSCLRWRSSSFSLCVVKYWNGLPASLVMWPSVCVFEKQSMTWIHRHFPLPFFVIPDHLCFNYPPKFWSGYVVILYCKYKSQRPNRRSKIWRKRAILAQLKSKVTAS